MRSGYNRNRSGLILPEILYEHDQRAVDQLTRDRDLELDFGFKLSEYLFV